MYVSGILVYNYHYYNSILTFIIIYIIKISSKEHQRLHWKNHKVLCRALKKYPIGTILEYIEHGLDTGIHLKVLRMSDGNSPYLLKDLGTSEKIKIKADCVAPSIPYYDREGKVQKPPERNKNIRFSVLTGSEMRNFDDPDNISETVMCSYFPYGIGPYGIDNILSERSVDGKQHIGKYYRIINTMKNDKILESLDDMCKDRTELKDYSYTIQHCPPKFRQVNEAHEINADTVNNKRIFKRIIT